MRAVLKAQVNKTDRNDARGIAQMMRAGLYRPVHVKTLRSQKLRMLLTHRKLLQAKAIAVENDLRATLGIAPCSVELCEASAAVNDVKRPSPFGQQRGCLFPFRSEQQARLVRPEVA